MYTNKYDYIYTSIWHPQEKPHHITLQNWCILCTSLLGTESNSLTCHWPCQRNTESCSWSSSCLPKEGNQVHGAADTRVSFASAVPLQVCWNSLLWYIVWVDMGRSPLPVIQCVYLLKNITLSWVFLPVDCQEDDPSLCCAI